MTKKSSSEKNLFTLSQSDLAYALMLAKQVEEFKEKIPGILKIAQEAHAEIERFSKPMLSDIRLPEPVYEASNNELLDEINRLRAEIKNSHSTHIVTYNQNNGILTCHIGNEVIEHPFERGSKQRKLVDALTEKKSFVSTPELLEITGSKNTIALSKLVGTVRDLIDNKFGFQDKFFIVNTPKSGYRINPKIKVRIIP